MKAENQAFNLQQIEKMITITGPLEQNLCREYRAAVGLIDAALSHVENKPDMEPYKLMVVQKEQEFFSEQYNHHQQLRTAIHADLAASTPSSVIQPTSDSTVVPPFAAAASASAGPQHQY